MWGIGTTELVVLLFIVMIVFGAGKLPQVGRSFGTAINEFKNAVKPKDEEEPPTKTDKTE
ncbi:MAG: twin-arginine translocase TatA/TatE family subunit [Candidatus Hydrogenedentes bacterium]|nr:twin-arginine translocase TatA/TatE family subunit [Candidatus Hydrogenedentota bacterium]